MTTFTDTWNAGFESVPPDTIEPASQGALRIRRHKLAVRERMAVCHSWAGDAHDGKVLVGRYRPQGSDPTLETGDGGFYFKVVSGVLEMFYKDDTGTVLQITRAGRLAPFADSAAPTKRAKLGLAGITAGQERTITVPDRDITIDDVTRTGFTTGDVKLTLKTVADTGWVMMNDGTIGNASSGGTTRANADTEALFTLLWNNVADTWAPVSGGRGANAAADFAANKTITLVRTLGRALGVSGAGATLTSRALGEFLGTETHTLITNEMPSHTHTQNAHSHTIGTTPGGAGPVGASSIDPTQGSFSSNSTVATNQNTGGGAAHPNMQPTLFLNVMAKL